jgi:hypothetical protein
MTEMSRLLFEILFNSRDEGSVMLLESWCICFWLEILELLD